MADPLSITAGVLGIVAFGHELTKTILAIKRLSRDVQGAPEELLEMAKDLENTKAMLDSLPSPARKPDLEKMDMLVAGSLGQCQKNLERLNVQISDLSAAMPVKRRRNAWKMVRDKESTRILMQKLHQSKADLHFAITLYDRQRRESELWALQKLLTCCGETRPTSQTIVVHCSSVHGQGKSAPVIGIDGNPFYAKGQSQRFGRRNKTCNKKVLFELPAWLCQDVWQLCFLRAAGCWTLTSTASRILPDTHPIWKAMRDPMFTSLLIEEFVNGGLSIQDCNTWKQSLLEVAISSAQTSIAKFLAQFGSGEIRVPWVSWHSTRRPIEFLDNPERNAHSGMWLDLDAAREHARFLLHECDIDEIAEAELPLCRALMKDQNEWTPMERLLALQTASEKFCDIGILLPRKEELAAELFQIALPYSTTSIPAGATLLHLLALEIMRKRLNTRVLSAIDYGLRCCALPHARNASGSTPFHTLITEWSAWRRPEGDMAVWLRLACQAGLYLEVYGQCEAAVVREAREMAIDAGLDSEDLYFRYISCGADPHHWKLWPRHPGDYFAGIFRDMVEHPERALPGSWLEPDPDWQYPDTGYEEPAIGPRRDPGVRRKTLRKFQKELRTFQRTGQAHSFSRIANMSDILRLVNEDARARKPWDAHTRYEFKDRLR